MCPNIELLHYLEIKSIKHRVKSKIADVQQDHSAKYCICDVFIEPLTTKMRMLYLINKNATEVSD